MFRPRRRLRPPGPGGGTGRHAVLRGQWREPSRFESGPGHQCRGSSRTGADCRGASQLQTLSASISPFPRSSAAVSHRSSVVELSIRNRVVVGSTPTGGSFLHPPHPPRTDRDGLGRGETDRDEPGRTETVRPVALVSAPAFYRLLPLLPARPESGIVLSLYTTDSCRPIGEGRQR
jgi:hypothetical protein